MYFAMDGKNYSFVWYRDFDESMLPAKKIYKKSNYYDVGSGFDIETTNFEHESKHFATMYCWQWSFDELTVIGRTWDEFVEMVKRLRKFYECDTKHKLLVFVHNLPFEWSFFRQWFDEIDHVLAKTKREIMTFTSGGMEFRDSLILTRFGLARMAKNYQLGLEKLKGDLDFTKPRISCADYQTPLELQEIAYCINDVQILQRFFHKYIKREFLRNGYKIPLTQTAIPRTEIKRKLKKKGHEFNSDYRDFIARCFPDENLYQLMRRFAFRGGYTHGNILAINNLIIEDESCTLAGYDRKSSYPASIFHEKMPTQYFDKDPSWFYLHFNEPESFWKDHGFIGAFKFKNIRAKYPHSIESKHKLVDWASDTQFDNGRFKKSSMVYTVLTEYDFLNYKDYYSWQDMKCVWIKTTKKEWLPKFILDATYSYFIAKETLPKDSVEYARAKEKLNSIFGMMATGLPESEYIMWNGNLWLNTDENLPEEIRQEKKSYDSLIKKCFLLPQWSITIASASRRELLKIFNCVPNATIYDALYGDTDSIKLRHWERYVDAIEEYNRGQYQENLDACSRWGYDIQYIKKLGMFVKEDEYHRFRVLGCKRYLYETKPNIEEHKPSEIQAVVAGMERGSFLHWCEVKNKDPFDEFKDGLYLKPEFSNKITSAYTDEEFSFELTDYCGITRTIREKSCCALYGIPFSMKMDADFLALIALEQKKEERRKEVYKDVL